MTTKTTGYYVHARDFDALLIAGRSPEPALMRRIEDAETFHKAMTVGGAQDLRQWEGDPVDVGFLLSTFDILAINYGDTLSVVDPEGLAARRRHYCGDAA